MNNSNERAIVRIALGNLLNRLEDEYQGLADMRRLAQAAGIKKQDYLNAYEHMDAAIRYINRMYSQTNPAEGEQK